MLAEVFKDLDWWKQRGVDFERGTETVRPYIEQLEDRLAKLERVMEAARRVDAAWDCEPPDPPYMDCIETDRLRILRDALDAAGKM